MSKKALGKEDYPTDLVRFMVTQQSKTKYTYIHVFKESYQHTLNTYVSSQISFVAKELRG